LNEKSYALLANYGVGYSGNRQHELVGIRQRSHGFNKGGLFMDKALTITANGAYTDNNHQDLIVDVPKSYFGHDKNCAELIKIGNIKNDSISCRVYSPDGKAVNQNANGGGQGCRTGLYKIGENVRKLTPRECCRLQTYDERVFEYFTIHRESQKDTAHKPYMSKNAFYNVFGDSFTVEVIVHILQCNKDMMGQ
jgi:site-specific DNA-cytosine methylase